MPNADTRTTKDLFRAWRSGDGEAGQTMAQRFADWYYAIATSRLGESRGRPPCENACAAFGQGIVNVTGSQALVGWAHGLVQAEVAKAGERARDGDEPCPYTGNQKPKKLLVNARGALPAEVRLLEAVYGGRSSEADIEKLASSLGGVPMGILQARYRVKRWLRESASVPFDVTPETPVLDRAPMPLYEAARMGSAEEESNFEQWMLTDIDLCKDIAEFAHFSIALRGGLPAQAEASTPPPATSKKPPPPPPGGRTPKPAGADDEDFAAMPTNLAKSGEEEPEVEFRSGPNKTLLVLIGVGVVAALLMVVLFVLVAVVLALL